MKTFFSLILLLLSTVTLAQQNYYVHSETSAIFVESSTSSELITQLQQYDNLLLLDSVDTKWAKVSLGKITGYTYQSDLRPGKAIVNTIRYRTGARCKDGTQSSATGRGACSHHGGVATWKYGSKTTKRIIEP